MSPEETAMQLILGAGKAKNAAFEGIHAAKEGRFAEAENAMKQAESELSAAHEVQSKALSAVVVDQSAPALLMIHAQDHLSMAMTTVELGEELIAVYRKLFENPND